VITYLIQQGAAIHFRSPDGVHNALTVAAQAQHTDRDNALDAVRLLVSHGADVNAASGQGGARGWVAIMQAAIAADAKMVRFLLSQGADLDAGHEERIIQPHYEGPTTCMSLEFYLEYIISESSENRQYFPVLSFIRNVRAAGGTLRGYLWAPRAELCVLRILCEQGRAVPPRGLLQLVFAWMPRCGPSAEN